MRTVVYARLSKDSTGEALGVERQQQDCTALVAQRGWTVVRTIVENDTSAAGKVVRPGFADLLAEVAAGRVDAIAAWSLDRLVRTSRDRIALIEACQQHRVVVALVRGSDMDPTTAGGRLVMGVLGEVAQHELDQRADRQRRAALQRAEQGRPWTSRRPFGYEIDAVTLRPDEARLLRQAYRDVLAGRSLRSITAAWTAAGITTTRGNAWRAETLGPTLRNPRNAGLRAYRGEVLGPAGWPGVVDEVVWRGVVAALSAPQRRTGGGARLHWLTGIARCGPCGAPLGSAKATSTGAHVYRCRSCWGVSRSMSAVDAVVRAVVVERLSRPDAAGLLDQLEDGGAREALATEAAALRAQLDQLAGDLELPVTVLRTRVAAVQARLDEITEAMGRAAGSPVLAALVGAPDVAATFDGMELDQRRAVVVALLVPIVLPARGGSGFRPESIKVQWVQPTG